MWKMFQCHSTVSVIICMCHHWIPQHKIILLPCIVKLGLHLDTCIWSCIGTNHARFQILSNPTTFYTDIITFFYMCFDLTWSSSVGYSYFYVHFFNNKLCSNNLLKIKNWKLKWTALTHKTLYSKLHGQTGYKFVMCLHFYTRRIKK